MPNYTRSKAQALKIIAKSGQEVTQVVHTAGTYDSATRTTTPTTANITRQGALFDYGDIGRPGVSQVRGELVKKTDKQLLVDGEAAIGIDDHFIVDGIEYKIVSIGGVNPAGIQVMYDLHLRA